MTELIYGNDDEVARLVAEMIPSIRGVADFNDFTAIGLGQGDELIGGVIFNNYTGFDVHVSIACRDHTWCTRKILTRLFQIVFHVWRCARLTAITGKKNKRTRRLLHGLGFKHEGVKRRGLDGKQDAMIYGMLYSECKWIGRYGKKKEKTRKRTTAANTAASWATRAQAEGEAAKDPTKPRESGGPGLQTEGLGASG